MNRIRLTFIITAVLTVLLAGCTSAGEDNQPNMSSSPITETAQPSQKPAGEGEATPPTEGPQTKEELAALFKSPQDAAAAVIIALKDSDIASLKTYVHPKKGVLFSPYVHIDAEHAQTFPAEELPGIDDDKLFVWGSYDGSGEPIELSFGDYYKKFVYDEEFINAEQIGWDEILSSGNTEPNLKETFPGCYIVDYHFSGFDKQYEGMDWKSLILAFEEHEGGWYVSAIVHSQWTI